MNYDSRLATSAPIRHTKAFAKRNLVLGKQHPGKFSNNEVGRSKLNAEKEVLVPCNDAKELELNRSPSKLNHVQSKHPAVDAKTSSLHQIPKQNIAWHEPSIETIILQRLSSIDKKAGNSQSAKEEERTDGSQTERTIRPKHKPLIVPLSARCSSDRPRSASSVIPIHDTNHSQQPSSIPPPKHNLAQKRNKTDKNIVDWIERYAQLRHRMTIIENDRNTTFINSKSDLRRDIAVINFELQEMEESRKIETDTIYRHICNLKHRCKEIQAKFHIMESGQEYIHELENMMEQMEEALAEFRRESRKRFDELIREERLYDREVSQYTNLFDNWDADNSLWGMDNQNESATNENVEHSEQFQDEDNNKNAMSSLSQHVRRLEEKLDKHTATGKWHEADERLFTRLLRKMGLNDDFLLDQNPPLRTKLDARLEKFIDKAEVEIPMKSAASIRAHIKWYVENITISREKTQAIQAWKEEKNKAKEASKMKIAKDIEASTEDVKKKTPKKDRIIGVSKQEHDKSEAISKWKEEQARIKTMEKLKEEAEMEKRRAAEAVEERRRLEIKQKLALYRLQKEQEQSRQKQIDRIAQTQNGRQGSGSEIRTFYERDMKLVREKVQKKKEEKKKKDGGSVLRRTATTTATRDPARLIKHTRASQGHAITKGELEQLESKRYLQGAHEEIVPGGAVASQSRTVSFGHVPIQARAVPAWRRNI